MKDKAIAKLKETGKYQLFIQVLESKNYELLYTMFGKTIYGLFTPFEYKRKDIKELLEAGNIPAIYNKYMLIDRLPLRNLRTRRKEDIKRLLSEKRYTELYESYGEREFNEHKKEILKSDVEYETGSKLKAKLYKSKFSIAKGIKLAVASLTSLVVSATGLVAGALYNTSNAEYAKGLEEYSTLIEQYDDKINEYAKEINNLGLDNDLEVVMKVMYDMWNEMEGYGNPELDLTGLYRLDFAQAGGKGVCRNIADDFSARMNAINPEYNARIVAVNADFSSYTKDSIANIDNHIAPSETISSSENNEDDKLSNLIDSAVNLVGNHMVSIIEPIGKNYTIVVDPTNPSIGIINNGKIYMFSTQDGKGLSFAPIGQILTVKNYDYNSVQNEISFESFVNGVSKEELIELTDEWGVEAQNQALEKITQNKRTY